MSVPKWTIEELVQFPSNIVGVSAPYTTTVAVVAAAGVLGCAYLAYQSYRRRLPQKWRQVGTLKSLYVFPIKSCGPVSLNQAEITTLGLRDHWLRDRFLMLVDENNNFITARTYPELVRVKPMVRNSILTLNYKNMDTLHINLAEVVAIGKPEMATVWQVSVPVYDCGKEAQEWFMKLLGQDKKIRLVHYASQKSKPLKSNSNKFYSRFTKDDTGAFGDEVSYNLINQASVDDLNSRLPPENKVTSFYFRPNFILDGTAGAYDEDDWRYVKIGENIFEIMVPCTRCGVTLIDPETGVRNANSEPLVTLRSYRQVEDPESRRAVGNSPRMGLQMALRSAPGGFVTVNDPIYVA